MKVLVADDNPDSRQLARDIVVTAGYEVVTAFDGPSALEAAHNEMPDLVILDVDMPGMTGYEVCAKLKAEEETAHIPVLMLTAQTDIENRVQGLQAGADDYLSKPYDPRELIARLETRLRAKSESDDLREKQQLIRSTFERFVHPSVVNQMLHDPSQVKLGGKLQEITVMFVDLEGFTATAEYTKPEKLLSILNRYHDMIVSLIQQQNGTIDKFLGDGVMALYNTPLPLDNHALYAVQTALAIRDALPDFHTHFEPEYQMKVNFGIHTGVAVVGNVGATQIMDFTAVGDTVNIAARLQGLSTNNQILISSATYERVANWVVTKPMGHLHVKNRKAGITTYEVLEWIR